MAIVVAIAVLGILTPAVAILILTATLSFPIGAAPMATARLTAVPTGLLVTSTLTTGLLIASALAAGLLIASSLATGLLITSPWPPDC